MKFTLIFTFLLCSINAFADRFDLPTITKVEPTAVIQETDFYRDEKIPITISGHNFWPSTTQKELRVQILLRRSQGGYIELPKPTRSQNGDLQVLKTHFRAREFLKEKGTLQVMVKVESRGSRPYTVAILPPPSKQSQITSISPSDFPTEQGLFSFRLYATDLDAPHQLILRIGNTPVPIEYVDLKSGFLEATVPKVFWNRPGQYRIQLFTRRGGSIPQKITVTED
jgi:hypothetical protein